MKTSLALFLALPLSLPFVNASAQEGADLLKKNGCIVCHSPDQKKAGPSLKDIAAKHKDAKDAKSVQAGILADLKAAKKHPKVRGSDDELASSVAYMVSGK
jgi:cytochrome c551/c552